MWVFRLEPAYLAPIWTPKQAPSVHSVFWDCAVSSIWQYVDLGMVSCAVEKNVDSSNPKTSSACVGTYMLDRIGGAFEGMCV